MILVRQLTKIFTLMTLLILAMTQSTNAASKSNELQYIKTYETESEGKTVFRIEIGLKRENIDYEVTALNENSNELLIAFENTIPGKLSRHNNGQIFLNGEETVTIKEVRSKYLHLQWKLPFSISNSNYKVQTEQKPNRLIIDIEKPNMKSESVEEIPFNFETGTIVIDAGHGGKDNGAIGANGIREKDVTLSVALKVQRMLEESGEEVVMTRTADNDVAGDDAPDGVELQSRVNKTPPSAKVFVSIHCNAFSNPKSNGMETFYSWGNANGKKLATILNEELLNYGGRLNRGVKGASFYLLKHATAPAASLVELAFVTNPEEELLLADDNYQEQLATAITRGIKRYLGK